jgi:hypothetical protein
MHRHSMPARWVRNKEAGELAGFLVFERVA